MTEKKLLKIMDDVVSEVMNENTHFFLTEYHDFENDSTFGMWGWSGKVEKIKNYVLYVAAPKTILYHNQVKEGTISEDLVDKLFNNKKITTDYLNGCTDGEKMFYSTFLWLKDSKGYDEVKKDITTMVKVLNEYGYKLNILVYEDAKEALPKALELDQYLPDDEPGFGEFLKECLED